MLTPLKSIAQLRLTQHNPESNAGLPENRLTRLRQHNESNNKPGLLKNKVWSVSVWLVPVKSDHAVTESQSCFLTGLSASRKGNDCRRNREGERQRKGRCVTSVPDIYWKHRWTHKQRPGYKSQLSRRGRYTHRRTDEREINLFIYRTQKDWKGEESARKKVVHEAGGQIYCSSLPFFLD